LAKILADDLDELVVNQNVKGRGNGKKKT